MGQTVRAIAAALSIVILAACQTSAPSGAPPAGTANPAGGGGLVSVIFPADTADAFAAQYCKGVAAAGEDYAKYGYKAECLGVVPYDVPKYNSAIDAAVAKGAVGIVAFALDPSINDHLKTAADKGVDVVLTIVGSPEDIAKS